MSIVKRAAAAGLALLIGLAGAAAPALAAGREFLPYPPPPGMTITTGTPTNALQLRMKVKLHPQFMRQIVAYRTSQPPGTLVVDTNAHFLYLVLGNGQALRYGIGVARDGFEWSGTHHITAKKEWPSWTPPAEMRARQPGLPMTMEGGPGNPLGARALYLYEGNQDTIYRIHGTPEPWTIGLDVSSGCIRMNNDDVTDLHSRIQVGAKVIVLMQGAALYKGV